MEKLRNEIVLTGYQPVCPHCGKDATAGGGLSHCMHCGQQFYYADDKSYPVRFR